MKIYRYFTGQDDAAFCHRITASLNNGWTLYGNPTLTYDTKLNRVICGQSMTKEVPGEKYTAELDLSKF